MHNKRTTVITYDRGYLHVEADSAFTAVCRAHCLLSVTHNDAFRIIDYMPSSAQVWSRGRYDLLLEYVGEWRVPVTYAMTGEGGCQTT